MVKNEVGTFLTNKLFCLKIYWGKWQINIIKKKSCSSYTGICRAFVVILVVVAGFFGILWGFFGWVFFFPLLKNMSPLALF